MLNLKAHIIHEQTTNSYAMKKIKIYLLAYWLLPWMTIAAPIHNFLVLADIHLNNKTHHRADFLPRSQTKSNDLDLPTFKALLTELKQSIQQKEIANPDFILVLGDIHNHQHQKSQDVFDNETAVFHLLQRTFKPTPIFYVYGNNDSFKRNYGPFTELNANTKVKNPYEVAVQYGHWQNGFLSTGLHCNINPQQYPCLLTEDPHNGYYAALIQPKLRLIALNSVLFSKRHFSRSKAAMIELHWLEQQLMLAEKNNEFTLIALHIPPGFNIYNHEMFWQTADYEQFLKIYATYQKTIIGILTAHTHQEEIKVIKNNAQKIIGGIFFTSALSTAYGNAPGVKTFYYNNKAHRWSLTNYIAYQFTQNANVIQLKPLYTYRDYYCLDKTTAFLQCLQTVSLEKIKRYFTNSNDKFAFTIQSPNDMVIYLNQ